MEPQQAETIRGVGWLAASAGGVWLLHSLATDTSRYAEGDGYGQLTQALTSLRPTGKELRELSELIAHLGYLTSKYLDFVRLEAALEYRSETWPS